MVVVLMVLLSKGGTGGRARAVAGGAAREGIMVRGAGTSSVGGTGSDASEGLGVSRGGPGVGLPVGVAGK